MKARLRSVFSHSAPHWEPSDILSSDLSQRSNSDTRSSDPKNKSNGRIRFHIKSSSSSTPPNPTQNSQLIRPRKSAISLTSIPDPELDARTNFQWQSTFFAKLPLEVRRMVYGFLFERETIHLTVGEKKDNKFGRKEKKLGNFICTHEHIGQCTCRVVALGSSLEASLPQLESAQLSLIRSCRRMYSECVYYLYAEHIFSILHINHLLTLPKRLPQQRLNTIRHLRLRWSIRALPYLRHGSSTKFAYHEDTETWERGWSLLAGMQGLETLHVVLIDPSLQGIWERNWLELEVQLLEPVKKVVKPKEFRMVMPYASCELERDMGKSCVVLKKPNNGDGEEQP